MVADAPERKGWENRRGLSCPLKVKSSNGFSLVFARSKKLCLRRSELASYIARVTNFPKNAIKRLNLTVIFGAVVG